MMGIQRIAKEYRARTVFANSLIAAGQAERVHSQFVADSASQLEWNFILRERANSPVT